jgi:hypothetical protein
MKRAGARCAGRKAGDEACRPLAQTSPQPLVETKFYLNRKISSAREFLLVFLFPGKWHRNLWRLCGMQRTPQLIPFGIRTVRSAEHCSIPPSKSVGGPQGFESCRPERCSAACFSYRTPQMDRRMIPTWAAAANAADRDISPAVSEDDLRRLTTLLPFADLVARAPAHADTRH